MTRTDPLASLPDSIKAQMTPWMEAMLSEIATQVQQGSAGGRALAEAARTGDVSRAVELFDGLQRSAVAHVVKTLRRS